eukprot:m.138928 g.138928  ORF g.138928 m.138928 type:complete len:60 (-) comp11493_c3_seq2:1840-2019(-)
MELPTFLVPVPEKPVRNNMENKQTYHPWQSDTTLQVKMPQSDDVSPQHTTTMFSHSASP